MLFDLKWKPLRSPEDGLGEAPPTVTATVDPPAPPIEPVTDVTAKDPATATTAAPLAKPKSEPWPDSAKERVAVLTARLNEARAQKTQTMTSETASTSDQEALQRQIDSLASQKAAEIAQQAEFDRKSFEVVGAGRKVYSDFNEKLDSLKQQVDWGDKVEVGKYLNFVNAAFEAGDSHRLLYDLGSDISEAKRIMALSPTRMAVELTKLALADPESVSKAPKPITPITTRSAPHSAIDPNDPERSDNLSTREWMLRRQNEVDAKRKARGY